MLVCLFIFFASFSAKAAFFCALSAVSFSLLSFFLVPGCRHETSDMLFCVAAMHATQTVLTWCPVIK